MKQFLTEVTFITRDAETNEIKNTFVTHNKMSINILNYTALNDTGFLPLTSRLLAYNTTGGSFNWNYGGTLGGTNGAALSNTANFTAYHTTFDYYEAVYRFPSPATAQTYTAFGICGSQTTLALSSMSWSYLITVIPLETTYTQSTTEVLDVVYRIIRPADSTITINSAKSYISSLHYDSNWVQTINQLVGTSIPWYQRSSSYSTEFQTSPLIMYFSPADLPSSDRLCWKQNYNGSVVGITPTITLTPRDATFSTTLARTDSVGQLIRTIHIGYTHSTFGYAVNSQTNNISAVFNHNSLSTGPFLDVNTLATSQGTVTPSNPAGITDLERCKLFNIQYRNTGAVGTARYNFGYLRTLGFNGNTYQQNFVSHGNRNINLMFGIDTAATPAYTYYDTYKDTINHSFTRGRYITDTDYQETGEWLDDYNIIKYDDSGFVIINVYTSKHKYFDSTNNGFNPGSIKQLTCRNGIIYIASPATGLWIIENATTTSPTVRNVTVSTFSQCHGVQVGMNNTIWAACNGGLCSSSDNGSTWTVYNESSTNPFTIANVTNSPANWSKISFIKCADDYDVILIATNLGTNIEQMNLYYWGTTRPVVTGQVVYSYGIVQDEASTIHSPTRGFQPELIRYLSGRGFYFGGRDCKILQIFSSNILLDMPNESTARALVVTDKFNNHYIHTTGITRTGTFTTPNTSLSATRNVLVRNAVTNQTIYNSTTDIATLSSSFPTRLTQNFLMYGPMNSKTGTVYKMGINFAAGIMSEYSMGLNIFGRKDTYIEDLLYTDYRWNGTAWVQDYHAPAVNSSTYSMTCPRKGFDLESHYFRGRSIVDIKPALTATTLSTTWTIAATVQIKDKIAYQDGPRTLFDIVFGDYERIALQISDAGTAGSSKLFVQSFKSHFTALTGTVGTTNTIFPSSGGTTFDRIVLSVNGTAMTVYINGVSVYSGTAPTSLNLGTIQRAYIGAMSGETTSNMPEIATINQFYSGTIKNFQIWNVAWTASDVATDYTAIYDVLNNGSYTSSNLIARFQFTEQLIESKPTHTTTDPLINGVNISFANGTFGNSFVESDYHTFTVTNGILKDNATTFTLAPKFYLIPTNEGFSSFSNGVNSTFSSTEGSTIMKIYTPGNNINSGQAASYPTTSANVNRDFGSYLDSSTYIGIEFSFGTTMMPTDQFVGLANNASTAVKNVNTNYYAYFKRLSASGNLELYVNTTLVATVTAANWNIQDTFQIILNRDSSGNGTLTFNRVQRNSTVTQLYTQAVSGVTTTLRFGGNCQDKQQPTGYCNIATMIKCPANAMFIGDYIAKTGVFSYDFYNAGSESYQLKLNGTEVPVTFYAGDKNTTPVAAVGTLVVNTSTGMVYCNSADAGKTLSGYITVSQMSQ